MLLSLDMVVMTMLNGSWKRQADFVQRIQLAEQTGAADVLVLYVFSNTDPEYIKNLKFFLREGVHPADGCEYLFVVNRELGEVGSQCIYLPTYISIFGNMQR